MTLHHYDGVTRTMRHHHSGLYRTRRPWARYTKTVLTVAAITAIAALILPPIVYALVDTFLLAESSSR